MCAPSPEPNASPPCNCIEMKRGEDEKRGARYTHILKQWSSWYRRHYAQATSADRVFVCVCCVSGTRSKQREAQSRAEKHHANGNGNGFTFWYWYIEGKWMKYNVYGVAFSRHTLHHVWCGCFSYHHSSTSIAERLNKYNGGNDERSKT